MFNQSQKIIISLFALLIFIGIVAMSIRQGLYSDVAPIIDSTPDSRSIPTVTDPLEQMSDVLPGVYHTVAEIKELSFECWCPYDAQCEPCREGATGRFLISTLSGDTLEVSPYFSQTQFEKIDILAEGKTFNFTIEKKKFDNGYILYSVLDFEPYNF